MKRFNTTLLHHCISFIIGIVIGFYFTNTSIGIYYGSAIAFISLGVLYHYTNKEKIHRYFFVLNSLICFGIVGYLLMVLHIDTKHQYYTSFKKEKAEIQVKILEKRHSNAYQDRYIAKLQAINRKHVRAKILLKIKKDAYCKPLEIADQLVFFGKIHPFSPSKHPHYIDAKSYYNKQNIFGHSTLCLNHGMVKPATAHSLSKIRAQCKKYIQEKINAYNFTKNSLGVLYAFTLGDKGNIDVVDKKRFARAGILHILAISGFHIGCIWYILLFLSYYIPYIGTNKKLQWASITLILWVFAFFTGNTPSVVRAVSMCSFLGISIWMQKTTSTSNLLMVSAFFCLLVQPFWVFSIGFQLSYAAVFSILLLEPKLYNSYKPKYVVLQSIWKMICVSIAAQLGVLPIGLYYFHTIPGLFIWSNLLVIPWVSFLIPYSFTLVILSITSGIFRFLVDIYNANCTMLFKAIAWIGNQETFYLENIAFTLIEVALAYAIIIWLCIGLYTPGFFRKKRAWMVCLLLFFLAFSYKIQQLQQENIYIYTSSKQVILEHTYANQKMLYTPAKKAMPYLEKQPYRLQTKSIAYKNRYIVVIENAITTLPKVDKPLIIVLHNNPKIHLEKLLQNNRIANVVVSTNNYKNNTRLWQQTCEKQKIPFHNIMEKGFFIQ